MDGRSWLSYHPAVVTPPSQFRAHVVNNRALRGGYVMLSLQGPVDPAPLEAVVPGQFVMLRGEWGRDLINPRAFSVLDADADGRFSVLLARPADVIGCIEPVSPEPPWADEPPSSN
ncbi:MAG: hypothetical protein AAGF11_49930 [Myxococcota bacterium]